MTNRLRCAITLAFVAAGGASAAEETGDYGPWRLGMSKKEVVAIARYGPYRDVASTGGVETAKGFFDNGPANVSFVFGEAGLAKIQIWVYEGRSIEEAIAGWFHVYDYFRRKYGKVESRILQLSEPLEQTDFAARVRALLSTQSDAVVKLQMAPDPMPDGVKVFSSLFRDPRVGFFVFVFYQQP